MCNKHIPIVVYDSGGTQKYCQECGKAVEGWKENDKPKKHPKKEKENKK